MATSTSKFSKALQSLTQSKIRELEKQRQAYEATKAHRSLPNARPQKQNRMYLFSPTKALLSDTVDDPKISNIDRWLDQARYDSSIPPETLESFEEHLISALNAHSLKLNIADLYSRLLTEWMDPSSSSSRAAAESSMEEDYEVVEERQKQRLQQLCDQFEGVVFKPLETDEGDIHAFLDALFPDGDSRLALDNLRERVTYACTRLWLEKDPFTESSLRSCIRGLLTEDLLSEEKQDVLKYFEQNKVALTEIADVLNMRYADLQNWDWHADEGIPVLPRQQLNGKYRIWIDDDVLQTIFVQYLADFIQKKSRDALRRKYYLTSNDAITSIETRRKSDYLEADFLFHMPLSMSSLSEREITVNGPSNIKQQLLRKIASQTLINRHIYGEAAVIQSDMKWYATALPHSTILTVMQHFGISEEWLAFFQKYLNAPLNMNNSAEGRAQTSPRIRKRGLVLFPMDLAVNRETGLLLYRIHDDLWVCGEPYKCVKAWEVMQRYAEVTGLEFNQGKTGSVYLSSTRDPCIVSRLPRGPRTETWEIDQSQVNAHVAQLQKQLNRCESVISWVKTWNSCIGRFFKNTLGQPAHCFGRAHMQNTLFNDQRTGTRHTVSEHLRNMIESRFGVPDVPDAFFFLPTELGGLGLLNPFLSGIGKFKQDEIESYTYAKKTFDEMSERTRRRHAESVNPYPNTGEPLIITEKDLNTFMSFEEYTRYRQSDTPYTETIQLTRECRDAIDVTPEEMWRAGGLNLMMKEKRVKWNMVL
ncbi:hypothetical protein BDV29DRAFT_197302 [Aspergillus leporis]|uniref:Reverse transcriptase domain-containing protein n=1 Tax=Aspergillus leporis TaxID=41062 RepID=A0A5N5WSQ2_9EURO|nr:hypothetical protein BDV29DRAFT_197302 [Aspergillus leporis]